MDRQDNINTEIAAIILQQLGGRRFLYITGSKNPTVIHRGLRLELGRNRTSANRLDIIYDEGQDLYKMRFYRLEFHKKECEVKEYDIDKYTEVYCDMLRDIFTDATGLYTSL